jgi:hypothetical protein
VQGFGKDRFAPRLDGVAQRRCWVLASELIADEVCSFVLEFEGQGAGAAGEHFTFLGE